MTFAQRRSYYIALMVVLAALSWLAYEVFAATLRDMRFVTGWALLVLILLLTLFNVRKKLPFLPLASASVWLRFHVYAGTFVLVLFVIHIQFRIPNGGLDILLAMLLAVLLLSGFVGLWLSRELPKRLTTRSEGVLFERIPVLMRELALDAKQLVLSSVAEANSKMIPDFYATRLMAFFERPRHFFFHLSESDRPQKKLLHEIADLNRYASPEEKDILRSLSDKVSIKSDLDYQYSLQWVLKGWLFVHIPLTYALLLVAVLHLLVAYDYRGNLP